jgi:hypothetical protein
MKMKMKLIMPIFVLLCGTSQAAPIDLMIGKTCTDVKDTHSRLVFLDQNRVQGFSDFGRPIYSYRISRNSLIVTMFHGFQKRFRIEENGDILIDLNREFPQDYSCDG